MQMHFAMHWQVLFPGSTIHHHSLLRQGLLTIEQDLASICWYCQVLDKLYRMCCGLAQGPDCSFHLSLGLCICNLHRQVLDRLYICAVASPEAGTVDSMPD
jgi:hypothetical protein